jgi:hypothetical protein
MANLSDVPIQDYSGGLNDTSSSYEIARNEASVLRNWDITYQGQLKRRDGLTLVGASISSNPITGLSPFIRNAGSDLLATESTNLWYLNGSSWAQIASGWTADPVIAFANIQTLGKVFIGSENNTIKSWDRAGTTINTCLTDLGAAVPHGNVMQWFQNYLLVMNNANVSGTKYPNRIYISALGDPTTFTTGTDYIDIPGDGRVIAAIQAGATTNSDTLLIFKERSIQVLTGYGIASWKITTSNNTTFGVDTSLGCVAPRGVVRVGDEIWFIDSQAQVRKLVRTLYGTFTDAGVVSTKIRSTLAGLNQTQLSQTVAWYHANKVYFSFPNGSNTTNNIVCVFDQIASARTQGESWTTYTGWNPSVMCGTITSGQPALYIGDATTGKVYKHAGLDDNGVAIDARWDGKDDFFDQPERYKRYKFGYIRATSGTTGMVNLYGSVDAGPFAQFESINLASGGSHLGPTGTARMGPTGVFRLGGSTSNTQKFFFTTGGGTPRGRSIKISIRHNATAQQPSVNGFSMHFRLRNVR